MGQLAMVDYNQLINLESKMFQNVIFGFTNALNVRQVLPDFLRVLHEAKPVFIRSKHLFWLYAFLLEIIQILLSYWANFCCRFLCLPLSLVNSVTLNFCKHKTSSSNRLFVFISIDFSYLRIIYNLNYRKWPQKISAFETVWFVVTLLFSSYPTLNYKKAFGYFKI